MVTNLIFYVLSFYPCHQYYFFTFSRKDCLDAPYVCMGMNCSKQYLAEDSLKDHKKKNPDCRNFGVGILQIRRNGLILINSTQTMVESREEYIPLDQNLQPKQHVNVDGVAEAAVEPNRAAIILN